MAEERPETGPGEEAAASDNPFQRDDLVLVVMIVSSPAILDDLVTGLLDIGLAATIVESKGLMALLREEMPIFGGLASMMPSSTGSRVALSLTTREMARRVFVFLEKELRIADRPIAFTVPVESAFGHRQ
ncbi:MAG: hypothetical protein KDA21_06840 [Phycisphaerales bacterium]|nr:hypothetical protein [Phycisphaerales bacterium]